MTELSSSTSKVQTARPFRKSSWMRRHRGLWFVLPSVIVILLVTIFPLLYALAVSFFRWNLRLAAEGWNCGAGGKNNRSCASGTGAGSGGGVCAGGSSGNGCQSTGSSASNCNSGSGANAAHCYGGTGANASCYSNGAQAGMTCSAGTST